MEHKHETPKSKSKNPLINKMLNNYNDSPFRLLPNVSTPPSRFAKICNPFEAHLIDRLHLPTFNNSPNVFSTKTQEKFRWDIDEISTFQPADIDETTVAQHVSDPHDPIIESIVQEKIEKFFNEKIIVPSPLNPDVSERGPVPAGHTTKLKPQTINNMAQTVLTLPPVLPVELEELLGPYFNYTEDQQRTTDMNTSLYRKLFGCHGDDDHEQQQVIGSIESSPAQSTGLSPIQLSPVLTAGNLMKGDFDSPIEMAAELRCCNLSPIQRSLDINDDDDDNHQQQMSSVCRLNFSDKMCIDGSLIVPDINRLPFNQTTHDYEQTNHLSLLNNEFNTTMDWDMEYKHVSILSQSPNTPKKSLMMSSRSRILTTSQRKRLSDSFKDVVDEQQEQQQQGDGVVGDKLSDNATDTGYLTGENSTWNGTHMFASTPTRTKQH